MTTTREYRLRASRLGAHYFALFTALATFVLLCSGGLVTSKNAGMTVPDWPTSYGYNMFLFPISRWVGGILYEHAHRLIASGVGMLTILLAVWLLIVEPRKWVKIFAGILVLAVCLQGLLGGLRVNLKMDSIGIFHALLAQSFLCGLAILTIVTGPRFVLRQWALPVFDTGLRPLALAATLAIFVQLGIGATMRHEHIGLSIPDFPLAYGKVLPDTSPAALQTINAARGADDQPATTAFQIWVQMVHRFMALVIAALVFTFAWRVISSGVNDRALRHTAAIWAGLILVQITLGALTIWYKKPADIATTHMALGALLLVLGTIVTFRISCGLRHGDFAIPDGTDRRTMA